MSSFDKIEKSNSKILGSVIKMNRLLQNMSQKALCEGVCVPSYLSRIENAEITASEEIIADLFNALNIKYNDSGKFIESSKGKFEEFYEELTFNEFSSSAVLFRAIEKEEMEYIHSPLIVDYHLIKLAFHCTRKDRGEFLKARDILESVEELMTKTQRFKYYLYTALDCIRMEKNYKKALLLLRHAEENGVDGHLYYWLAYTFQHLGSYLKAIENLNKALQLYLEQANVVSILGTYEMMGLTYYYMNYYLEGDEYYQKALKMANKMKNKELASNSYCNLAWSSFRRGEHEQALTYADKAEVYDEKKQVVSPDIIKLLCYKNLNKFEEGRVLCRDIKRLYTEFDKAIYEWICLELKEEGAEDTEKHQKEYEEALLNLKKLSKENKIELHKYVCDLLVQFYKKHRRYKEALEMVPEILVGKR